MDPPKLHQGKNIHLPRHRPVPHTALDPGPPDPFQRQRLGQPGGELPQTPWSSDTGTFSARAGPEQPGIAGAVWGWTDGCQKGGWFPKDSRVSGHGPEFRAGKEMHEEKNSTRLVRETLRFYGTETPLLSGFLPADPARLAPLCPGLLPRRCLRGYLQLHHLCLQHGRPWPSVCEQPSPHPLHYAVAGRDPFGTCPGTGAVLFRRLLPDHPDTDDGDPPGLSGHLGKEKRIGGMDDPGSTGAGHVLPIIPAVCHQPVEGYAL